MRRADFAYAQARMQARLGAVWRTTHWATIEASRSAAEFLALLRGSALSQWVEGFDPAVDPHRVESALREKWTAHVAQVAGWVPPPWRPAVRWFGLLPELARLDAARRTGRFSETKVASPSAEAPSVDHAEETGPWPVADTELAPFAVRAEAATDTTAAIWSAVFGKRLPAATRAVFAPAHVLLPVLAGRPLGRGLASERTVAPLVRLLHQAAGSPAAAFAYLALVALDVERVRGGLLARLLLAPAPREEAA